MNHPMSNLDKKQVQNTIKRLGALRDARRSGHPDTWGDNPYNPTWLVHMAINRRAGWPDVPGFSYGSCAPLPDGRCPSKCDDTEIRRLARWINTPRVIVREGELNCMGAYWKRVLKARLPKRFTSDDDF